jgi:predicted DCC family thiol-disulfide oxidoreductase YuxK
MILANILETPRGKELRTIMKNLKYSAELEKGEAQAFSKWAGIGPSTISGWERKGWAKKDLIVLNVYREVQNNTRLIGFLENLSDDDQDFCYLWLRRNLGGKG